MVKENLPVNQLWLCLVKFLSVVILDFVYRFIEPLFTDKTRNLAVLSP